MASSKAVFICAAKRTPMGDFGKSFLNKSATELAEIASRAALASIKLDAKAVDSIVFGNVIQSSKDAAYLTRHVGLHIGMRTETPALTVNRLCGSGFQSVVNAAQEIKLGDSNIVIAGGTENMSQCPFAVRNVRFGTALGAPYAFEDTLWEGLTDAFIKTPMGITAENLGAKYGVTRQEADNFALLSQNNWKKAQQAGVFKEEIVPVEVKTKKGPKTLDCDEPPRDTTIEQLTKLKAVFKKDGLVTAGNASGISDGAAAMVVASEEAVKQHGLKPLARLVAYNAVGCDPHIMGIGPAEAIRSVLKQAGLNMGQIDLIEVNEAFAPQALAVQREVDIPSEKYNCAGGAIALGHPLGASGARITTHLVHEMIRRKAKYSIGSACIGGGQGIALLLENVN